MAYKNPMYYRPLQSNYLNYGSLNLKKDHLYLHRERYMSIASADWTTNLFFPVSPYELMPHIKDIGLPLELSSRTQYMGTRKICTRA